MTTCMEPGCSRTATHILVSYRHAIVNGGLLYCQQHAFDNGREECPCCDSYPIEFDTENGDRIELLPTYPAGALDNEGCCSEHP